MATSLATFVVERVRVIAQTVGKVVVSADLLPALGEQDKQAR